MAEVGKPGSGTSLRVNVYDANAEGLEAGALEGLRAIMAFMRAKSFIHDYKLDADDYDRQSWDEGFTLELKASVYEPGGFRGVWGSGFGTGVIVGIGLIELELVLDCVVTAFNDLSTYTTLIHMTATLGGNTLFTSEGFLFHPDYVGGACVHQCVE